MCVFAAAIPAAAAATSAATAAAVGAAGVGVVGGSMTAATIGSVAAGGAATAAAAATPWLTYAGLASSLLGTGLSAYGSYQQGQAMAGQAEYQAAVARNNQIIAERNAQDAELRGGLSEDQQRRQTAQLKGRQRASLASNGVVIDEGSALDITSDTAAFGEFDALTIRSNAQREAYNYRVQGSNFQAEENLMRMRGAAGSRAGTTGAVSTLLSGAGSVADKWYGYKYGNSRYGGVLA